MLTDGIQAIVAQVTNETNRIKSYLLQPADGDVFPSFEAGAHLDILTPSGQIRQYSLSNPPQDAPGFYEIAVLREEEGRGGSREIHNQLAPGQQVTIGSPRNNFPLRNGTGPVILLAGGVGITPILSMAWQLYRERRPFDLHYCCRTADDAAFLTRLRSSPFAEQVHCHESQATGGGRADLKTLLKDPETGSQLYCCGPSGFIDAVIAESAHWPDNSVFTERFQAVDIDESRNASFEVEIKSSGAVLPVAEDQTILQVLRANGVAIESMCEDGLCGSCETALLAGEADHRDSIQTDAEKSENNFIMVCCSRAKSPRLTLDL